jgi:hypothetical protein
LFLSDGNLETELRRAHGPEVLGLYRQRRSEKKAGRFVMLGGAFDTAT